MDGKEEKYPLVYVVTKNYNQYQLTSEFIQSFKKLTYPNHRIIIIDSASTDDSADKIEKDYPEVELIRAKTNIGYCEGLNIGIKEGLKNNAEYFFVLNNDTKDFSHNYFEEVIRAFEEDDKIGLVGSWCYDYGGNIICDGTPKYKFGLAIVTPTEGYVIKREAFEKIGLLDETLVSYVEDLDFIARLRNAGYNTKSISSVSFAHLGGAVFSKQLFAPNYYRVRNHIWFMRRYCNDNSLSWKLLNSIIWLRGNINRLASYLIKLQFKSFFMASYYIIRGLFDGLTTGTGHKEKK